jgi:NADP-dependent 3-hydroxy acid dehydrogenase YdfG
MDANADFEGMTAFVTGAGGDIGAAIAESLHGRGAVVGLVGRRAQTLRRVAGRIGVPTERLFTTDLTSDPEVRATARTFLRRFGRLDVLVHSNGIHLTAPLAEAKLSDFDRLWAANVRSPFLLTQTFTDALRESSGQIVFVNSSIVHAARPGVGLFAATQHALRGLADALRTELNPAGVRVLSVFPGRTATTRQESIFKQEGRAYEPDRLLQPSEIASVVTQALALPRTAEVTDVDIRPMAKPA